MFFQTWWQAIIFGVATTVALLAVSAAFEKAWRKYDQAEIKKHSACDSHH